MTRNEMVHFISNYVTNYIPLYYNNKKTFSKAEADRLLESMERSIKFPEWEKEGEIPKSETP